MGAYIFRRLLLVIPTLIGVMVVNFMLTQLVPAARSSRSLARLGGWGDAFESIAGGPATAISRKRPRKRRYVGARGLPPEFIAQLEGEFGFDRPPLERFLMMIGNYVRFDLGESCFRRSGR